MSVEASVLASYIPGVIIWMILVAGSVLRMRRTKRVAVYVQSGGALVALAGSVAQAAMSFTLIRGEPGTLWDISLLGFGSLGLTLGWGAFALGYAVEAWGGKGEAQDVKRSDVQP